MPAVHLTVPELRVALQALGARTHDCPLVAGARRQLEAALPRPPRSGA